MLPLDREPRAHNRISGESIERFSPEITVPMSSPYGREALMQAGQLDPAVRRIGDDLMLRTGRLDFANIMPREGTLDFLRDPVANAEAQAIQQMAAQWRAEHPGEPLPKELAKLLRGLSPQAGGLLDVGEAGVDGGASGGDEGGGSGGGGGGGGGGRRRRGRRRSGGSRRGGGDSSRRRGRNGGNEENGGADEEENPSGSGRRREGGRSRNADGGDEAPAGRRANRGGREPGEPRAAREPGEPRAGRDSAPAPGERRGGDDARPTELRGGTRAEKIFNFLTNDLNLSRAQAAGVLGNFIQETAQLDPKQPGDGGNAIGIAQWNGPRKRALFAFARENGASATELDTQLKFLKHELQTTERGAFNALKRTSTPEQAALSFSRLFERPGNPMNGNRVANARMAFNRYGRSDDSVQVASR